MAISYVGGVVAGRTGNSNSTVDVSLSSGLTGGSNSGVSAGDLVVVTVCTGSAARSSVVAVTAPATYQNLTAQRTTATTYDTNVQVSYKFMPSTTDSVVTIPAQGNIADGQAYAVQVFRGVDPNIPLDVTPTYATGSGTNNNPNPAAITPTTAGAWIVVTGGGASATGANYTASYLTNFLTANGADTNDGTVGAGYYTGWTSGSYDPAAFGGGSANAANSWGATTIALRPAPETQALTPTLYSNGQTFYAPTITVGAVGLTPTLYENTNTFYAAAVTQPGINQDLTASLYENSNTFYAATVTTSITLSAALYENSSTFYQPTITTGAVTLTAALFTNDNTLYQPSVSRGSVTLSASLYSNASVFYAPVIAKGAVTLNATLYSNANTFYAASISTNGATQTLNASLLTNANSFYTASIKAGSVTLNAGLFQNANAFYAPSISIGGITLSLDIFVNASEFYSANIQSSYPQYLQSGLLTNINAFYPAKVIKVLAGRYPLAGMMKAYPVTIENSYALENEGRNYPVAGIKPSRPLKTHKHDRPNKGKK